LSSSQSMVLCLWHATEGLPEARHAADKTAAGKHAQRRPRVKIAARLHLSEICKFRQHEAIFLMISRRHMPFVRVFASHIYMNLQATPSTSRIPSYFACKTRTLKNRFRSANSAVGFAEFIVETLSPIHAILHYVCRLGSFLDSGEP